MTYWRLRKFFCLTRRVGVDKRKWDVINYDQRHKRVLLLETIVDGSVLWIPENMDDRERQGDKWMVFGSPALIMHTIIDVVLVFHDEKQTYKCRATSESSSEGKRNDAEEGLGLRKRTPLFSAPIVEQEWEKESPQKFETIGIHIDWISQEELSKFHHETGCC